MKDTAVVYFGKCRMSVLCARMANRLCLNPSDMHVHFWRDTGGQADLSGTRHDHSLHGDNPDHFVKDMGAKVSLVQNQEPFGSQPGLTSPDRLVLTSRVMSMFNSMHRAVRLVSPKEYKNILLLRTDILIDRLPAIDEVEEGTIYHPSFLGTLSKHIPDGLDAHVDLIQFGSVSSMLEYTDIVNNIDRIPGSNIPEFMLARWMKESDLRSEEVDFGRVVIAR